MGPADMEPGHFLFSCKRHFQGLKPSALLVQTLGFLQTPWQGDPLTATVSMLQNTNFRICMSLHTLANTWCVLEAHPGSRSNAVRKGPQSSYRHSACFPCCSGTSESCLTHGHLYLTYQRPLRRPEYGFFHFRFPPFTEMRTRPRILKFCMDTGVQQQ